MTACRPGLRPARRPGQRGQALVVLLLLLPVLTAAAVLAVRGAIVSARQLQAQLTATQAQEAAGFALRQCEALVMAPVLDERAAPQPTPLSAAQAEQIWNRLSSWRVGAAGLRTTSIAGPGGRLLGQGQCLSQRLSDGAGGLRFVVTARGLSGDAQVSAQTGILVEGAEAWQQSVLRKAPDPCPGSTTPPAPTCTPEGWTRRWRVLITPPSTTN
ncbi:hypothetical protein SAMN05880557_102358 [Pseudacidovorax sp. RU35E]|nr:hypothetical protein SAMN05880557_102358 [Pseudacidovorax sp. RU35E]